jgi:hypothetical protein
MDKLENRKLERRRKNMEALGIDRDRQKNEEVASRVRRLAAQRVDGERDKKLQHNEQVIKYSVFDIQVSSTFDDARQDNPKSNPNSQSAVEHRTRAALDALNANLASTPRV